MGGRRHNEEKHIELGMQYSGVVREGNLGTSERGAGYCGNACFMGGIDQGARDACATGLGGVWETVNLTGGQSRWAFSRKNGNSVAQRGRA